MQLCAIEQSGRYTYSYIHITHCTGHSAHSMGVHIYFYVPCIEHLVRIVRQVLSVAITNAITTTQAHIATQGVNQ